MFKPIQISGKNAMLMKPYKNPSYGSKTVLTDSAWEYVELFLERKTSAGSGDALFFWRQAHSFYLASQVLPDNSKPLTSYCSPNKYLNISVCPNDAILRQKSSTGESLPCGFFLVLRRLSGA